MSNEYSGTATALAHPNIAFIKYWGNRDVALRLPVNPSLSMNLDGLATTTCVTFDPSLLADSFELNSAQHTTSNPRSCAVFAATICCSSVGRRPSARFVSGIVKAEMFPPEVPTAARSPLGFGGTWPEANAPLIAGGGLVAAR